MNKHFLGMAAFVLASLAAGAQTPLSLQQALDHARAHSPALAAVRYAETAVSQTQQAARGGLGPQVRVTAALTYTPYLPANIIPVGQFQPVPTDEVRTVRFGTEWSSNASVVVTQPLINAFQRAEVRTEAARLQQTQADRAQTEESLIIEIHTAYYEVLLRQAETAYARADSQRSARTAADLAQQLQAGTALSTEATRASLNLKEAQLNLQNAQRNEVIARARLAASLHATAAEATSWVLTDALPGLVRQPDFVPQPPQPSNRPDILREEANAAVGTARALREARSGLPRLNAEGSAGVLGYTPDANFFADNVWTGTGYVGLRLDWNLWDGAARRARTARFEAEAAQAQAQLLTLTDNAQYERQRAAQQRASAAQALNVRREQLALAQADLDVVNQRAQVGQALARERLDADAAVAQAQRNLLQATYDFLVADLDYRRAAGLLLSRAPAEE